MAVYFRVEYTADGVYIVLCNNRCSVGIFVVTQMEGPNQAVVRSFVAFCACVGQLSVDQTNQGLLALQNDGVFLIIICTSGIHGIRIGEHDGAYNGLTVC